VYFSRAAPLRRSFQSRWAHGRMRTPWTRHETALHGHTGTQHRTVRTHHHPGVAWPPGLCCAAGTRRAARTRWRGASGRRAVPDLARPRNGLALCARGLLRLCLALSNAGDLAAAEGAYRKAIEIYPDFVQPRLNLGMLYERMGRIDNALEQWRWVAEHANPSVPDQAPLVVMALNHLGRVLESHKQLADASRYLERSLQINPDQSDALHHWVHLQQKQCIWPVYAELPGVSLQAMQQATSALAMLGISDDPQAQLEAARRFVEKKVQSAVPQLAQRRNYGHRRLRIGYACIGLLPAPGVRCSMAELFELHDRDRFEVYGYCCEPRGWFGAAPARDRLDGPLPAHPRRGRPGSSAAYPGRARSTSWSICKARPQAPAPTCWPTGLRPSKSPTWACPPPPGCHRLTT